MNEKLSERIADALMSGIAQGLVEGALAGLGQTLLCEAKSENDVGKLIAGKALLSIVEKLRSA